jgi:hypothetical protein
VMEEPSSKEIMRVKKIAIPESMMTTIKTDRHPKA